MQITLAPSPHPWTPDVTSAFYSALEKAPIDTVVLGETVCSQRDNLSVEAWIELGTKLSAADHAVRLATPILVDSPAAMTLTQEICGQFRFPVEASDTTAIALLHAQRRPFATSPALSVYNAHSLHELVRWGLTHWCVPIELSRSNLLHLTTVWASAFPGTVLPGIELTVYGYPMLSCSARCFTAQAYSRHRAHCEQICRCHPAGMTVNSLEEMRLFLINGPQVCSGELCNLLPCLDDIRQIEIPAVRIIPFSADPAPLLELVHSIHAHPAPLPETFRQGSQGYWLGEAGMAAPAAL